MDIKRNNQIVTFEMVDGILEQTTEFHHHNIPEIVIPLHDYLVEGMHVHASNGGIARQAHREYLVNLDASDAAEEHREQVKRDEKRFGFPDTYESERQHPTHEWLPWDYEDEPSAPHEDEYGQVEQWVVAVAPINGADRESFEVMAYGRTDAINTGIVQAFGRFATRTTRGSHEDYSFRVAVKVFGIEVATIDASPKRRD